MKNQVPKAYCLGAIIVVVTTSTLHLSNYRWVCEEYVDPRTKAARYLTPHENSLQATHFAINAALDDRLSFHQGMSGSPLQLVEPTPQLRS